MPNYINHTPIDADLVDRIFEYLLEEFPQIAGPGFAKAKKAVRAEFAGERPYIASKTEADRHALAVTVLGMFNGRNAREIARRLGIGRTTVYRIIKQAGEPERPTFAVNGTATGLRSDAATTDCDQKPEPPAWPSPPPTSQPSTPPLRPGNSRSRTTGEPSRTDR